MPATLPGPPFQPTISALSSTSISLEWSFDDATYNGGTPIIDYKVYYDNGVSGQTLLMAGTTSLLTAYRQVDRSHLEQHTLFGFLRLIMSEKVHNHLKNL